MLTDTQLEIAETVLGTAGSSGFALAGGGALIVHGVVDRSTRDLDFFTQRAEEITETARRVERQLAERGFVVSRRMDSEGFVRMVVQRGDEICEVDLGHDARRWPTTEHPGVGATISLEELAADKTLALVGRAAARDFVDVHALEKLFGPERLCELAADKDLGFGRRHLADALGKLDRLDRNQFEISEAEYTELCRWSSHWRATLLEQSRALEREQGIAPERDREGPEIGR